MPTSATIHIQKIAPGPPSVSATATPAMLPVPTRLASDTDNAWNGVMPSLSVSPDPRTQRHISAKWTNCRKPRRRVK